MDDFYGNHLKSVSLFSTDDSTIICLHNYNSLDFYFIFLFLHHSLETERKLYVKFSADKQIFKRPEQPD